MSSASQIDYTTMREDQLAEMLSKSPSKPFAFPTLMGSTAVLLQWFHLRIHSRKTQRSHVLSLLNSFGKTGRQAETFMAWYDDGSGATDTAYAHGGIRSVVEEVIRDMGFRESELDIELVVKVIGALLGDDGMEIWRVQSGTVFKAAKDRDVTRTSVSIIVPGPAVTTLGALVCGTTVLDSDVFIYFPLAAGSLATLSIIFGRGGGSGCRRIIAPWLSWLCRIGGTRIVEFAREAFSTGSLRAALCSLLRPYGFLARKLLVTYSSAKLFLLKLKTRVSGDKSAIITYSKTKYTSAKEKKKSGWTRRQNPQIKWDGGEDDRLGHIEADAAEFISEDFGVVTKNHVPEPKREAMALA
ncbi:hypothetical protein BGY98DRAFT_940216 [Russula aff. rugulosa BPL654]|nr:hypothetical protein BGY98DRAFT_940216 [Russula aff. rugulosa BPL654]